MPRMGLEAQALVAVQVMQMAEREATAAATAVALVAVAELRDMENQMNNIAMICGAKKGQSSEGAVEADDTLRSRAYAQVLDAISEGEIEGLVNGARSIYLDGTPLEGADGKPTFDVKVDLRNGTQGQAHIEGFPSVESEIAVGVEVKKASAVTRTITNQNVDAVRVKLQIPQLSEQDKKNGNLNGSAVKIAIEMQMGAGAFTRVVEEEINGKTMSSYERAYRIELPGSGPWSIRMVRLSDDSSDSAVQNKTFFSSMTEIIDTKLSYPNTAIVGIRIDAKQFNSVPERAYHMRLLRVKVPVNYSPETRTYAGPWDGTFKIAWTNNPAWCFYDLITNERYGLGQHIPNDAVDKWTLYSIGQYCDQMVPDGKGGMEPRFAMNAYIQTREDAYKLLNDMAGAFRGLLYWSGGSVITTQDAPGDATYLFSNANVIEGEFSYSGSSAKARHTVALVTWNDLSDMGRQKVEYVEDAAGIARHGVITTEVAAFGCTSQGQAHRVGRWILLSELTETETVTFSTGLEGVAVAPGGIVKVRDNYRHGKRLGGRVVAVTGTQITLDSEVQVPAGGTLYVVGAEGRVHTCTVSGSGAVLVMSKAMSSPAVSGATWVINAPGEAPPKDYRVISVSEREAGIYEVTALEYNAEKYAMVDDVTRLASSDVPPGLAKKPETPKNLKIGVVDYRDGAVQKYKILLAWDAAGPEVSHWEVEHRDVDSNPAVSKNIAFPLFEIDNAKAGYHTLRVRSVGPRGSFSPWTDSTSIFVGAKSESEVFDSAEVKAGFLSAILKWSLRAEVADTIRAVEIWGRPRDTPEGTEPPAPIMLGTTASPGVEWVHTDLAADTYWIYRIRPIDVRGNAGAFYPQGGMIAAPPPDVVNIRLEPNFNGQDMPVAWDAIPAAHEYLVEVLEADTVLRQETSPSNSYIYTYGKNVHDGGPRRQLTVRVRARTLAGESANWATGTFTNEAPPEPSGLTLEVGPGQIGVMAARPADEDLQGMVVWGAVSSGFDCDETTLIYQGSDNAFVKTGLQPGMPFFFKVAFYDVFGMTGLNISSEVSATPTAAGGIVKVTELPENPEGAGGELAVFLDVEDLEVRGMYGWTGTEWISTSALLDGSVTTAKLGPGAVDFTKLAAGAVQARNLAVKKHFLY